MRGGEVNGACRGALPGGDACHMLLQDSLLGALAVQVIWGLCWAASRTLGTLDQRRVAACVDCRSPHSESPSALWGRLACSRARQYGPQSPC